MKTEKTVIETYKNLLTGKNRTVTYNRIKNRNGISPLYKKSDSNDYFTHGFLGWTNVNKYIK